MHTIDVVYLTCLGIGVCYALVAFLAGNLHLPNVHIGHDAGGGMSATSATLAMSAMLDMWEM